MAQHHFDEVYEHEGTSDATPGGYENARRPGEVAFAVFLALFSLALLWNAYGISGFEALSGPGTIPMLTATIMLVTSGLSLRHTLRQPRVTTETLSRDILPRQVVLFFVLLILYGILLRPWASCPPRRCSCSPRSSFWAGTAGASRWPYRWARSRSSGSSSG